ncbi:6-phospho-3-hexuloisomerase [Sphingobacterium sp. LRF_L2]|uniref:6-phospho-3-hexuloisomerase n=1 Tax=Sphingobacterium sp. LRF_L2 TaxID=3369421 RepID=UPI003F632C0D
MENAKKAQQHLEAILEEHRNLFEKFDFEQISASVSVLKEAKRLFFLGLGRSGLALKMGAMRLMHLGYEVYVVGEIVTPAIMEGDVLIVASGSGTTGTVLAAVEKAKKQQAGVLAITADGESPLAQIADQLLLIPAATKTDFSVNISEQYAGSLFEQAVLLVSDSIFWTLWQESGLTKEDLWPKHANLE